VRVRHIGKWLPYYNKFKIQNGSLFTFRNHNVTVKFKNNNKFKVRLVTNLNIPPIRHIVNIAALL
jgi:hypothetical protein